MPDTYVFRRGMTRQKLVDDMQAAQAKLLDELWADAPARPLSSKTQGGSGDARLDRREGNRRGRRAPGDRLGLPQPPEAGHAPAVRSDDHLWHCGRQGQARPRPDAQTTSTTETPYNTYRINGLPPGPIANPGRAALEAVLNPATTDYLYFVADGTGGHAFAATLERAQRQCAEVAEDRRQRAAPPPRSRAEAAPATAPRMPSPQAVEPPAEPPHRLLRQPSCGAAAPSQPHRQRLPCHGGAPAPARQRLSPRPLPVPPQPRPPQPTHLHRNGAAATQPAARCPSRNAAEQAAVAPAAKPAVPPSRLPKPAAVNRRRSIAAWNGRKLRRPASRSLPSRSQSS